jgi:hypothetical protein
MSESKCSQWFKRRIDFVDDDPGIDSRPRKLIKLDSAEAQAAPNPLPDKKQQPSHDDHSARPALGQDIAELSKQETLQSQATEKPPTAKRPPTGRTQITKIGSALKLWQADTNQQLKEMKERQDDAIKTAVKNAIEDKVANAIEQAEAAAYADAKKVFLEELPREVKRTVAARLSEEVKKVKEAVTKDADEAGKKVQEAVLKDADEAIKKVQEAVLKDADEAVKKAQEAITDADEEVKRVIAKYDADFKQKKAEFDNELQELRKKLEQSEDLRQKSEKQYEKLVTLADQHATVIAEVQKAAEQAVNSAKEADEKLQKALEEKEAAESAIASLQEKVDSHHDLLEQQKEQLKRLHHHFGVEPSNLMDLDRPTYAAYPSPNSSEGERQTPNSWSQSQNSTSRFTNSTSSTTNDGSANDRKPRQAMRWSLGGSANSFTNSTRRKVVDTENIAMEHHSRMGYSNDPPSSDESDEELPTPNAPSSQYSQFQSPAEQATGSFGRPTASFSGHFSGAGQSNSHRAPRSTPFQIDYSQQRGHDLSGAERSSSRRESRSSRTDYAPTEERVTYPPRHTPSSRGQTNYAHQQHHQEQHQYANNDLDGAAQSNFRGAATPSRKRTYFDGNDMSEYSHNESGSKRVRFADNTYQSNFSHPQSQFPPRGRGGSRGSDSGRGRGGNTLRDLAPLNGTPQTPSSYVPSPSHNQNRHTQRGQAPFSNVTQLPSSYEESPRYDHSGNTPTGPARWRNSTAAQPPSSYVASPSHTQGGYTPASQPRTFDEQSSSQERDPYKADREINVNKRKAVDENLRAPQFHGQSQRQQQPQQPQHNGRGTLNRNGRARNGNAEDSRDSQYDNPRYVPSPQPQGPRTFGRPTHASSSRQEEPVNARVRPSIEDEGEAQTFRDGQQLAEQRRRKETASRAQHGAQQTNTPRTPAPPKNQPAAQQQRNARAPAPAMQSFRDARGLSPEGRAPGFMDEGLTGILASAASAQGSFNGKKGLIQKSAKSAGGSLESRMTRPLEDDEFSTPHSFNGKKGPAQHSANPTGGDLFSRVTFPSDEDDFSESHSSNNKGKGAKRPTQKKKTKAEMDAEMDAYQASANLAQGISQTSANPKGGDVASRATYPPKPHQGRRQGR